MLIEDSLGIQGADANQPAVLLAKATVAAIARHHFSFSSQYQAIALIDTARDHLAQVLHDVRQTQGWSFDLDQLELSIQSRTGDELRHSEMTIIPPDTVLPAARLLEVWCYFVLVRTLRLCDWRSFDFQVTKEG